MFGRTMNGPRPNCASAVAASRMLTTATAATRVVFSERHESERISCSLTRIGESLQRRRRELCTWYALTMCGRLFFALSLALLMWPARASTQKTEGPPTAEHEDAMRRAQVWFEPAVPIEQARLGENPPGSDSFSSDQQVVCTFKPGYMGGSTPKFDCELSKGD